MPGDRLQGKEKKVTECENKGKLCVSFWQRGIFNKAKLYHK